MTGVFLLCHSYPYSALQSSLHFEYKYSRVSTVRHSLQFEVPHQKKIVNSTTTKTLTYLLTSWSGLPGSSDPDGPMSVVYHCSECPKALVPENPVQATILPHHGPQGLPGWILYRASEQNVLKSFLLRLASLTGWGIPHVEPVQVVSGDNVADSGPCCKSSRGSCHVTV